MNRAVSTATLIAVMVLSAAALAYELLLVRMFSIIHWYHFAFMVISMALLGYGVSGSVITIFRNWLMARYTSLFVMNAILFAVSSIGCFIVVQQLPFNALEIIWDQQQWLRLFLCYLLLSLPFFFVSNAIAMTMMRYPAQLPRIYGIDLMGAGLGALIFMLLLQILTHETLLRVIAIAGFIAAISCAFLLTHKRRSVFITGSALLIVLVLIIPNHWLELKITVFKGLEQSLQVKGARQLDQLSDAMSRIDVVESNEIPIRFAPGMSINNPHALPPQLMVFRDGDEMTTIDHGSEPHLLFYQNYLTSALPYHVMQTPGRILLLGTASGDELHMAALHAGIHVDAVEDDAKLNWLISERYASYFNWPAIRHRVSLHSMSARSFIATTQHQYDLISLVIPGASTGAAAGVHSLATSYEMTREAINAYFNHLEPDGFLAITMWTSTPAKSNLRLFATVVDVLQQRVQNSREHIAWIRSWNTATLLIKNSPLTKTDSDAIRQFSQQRAYDIAWLPQLDAKSVNRYSILQQPIYHLAASALLSESADAFIENYKYDIAPLSDDRPYFNNTFKWSVLHELAGKSGAGGIALMDTGYPTLILTLLQSLLAAIVLILLPLLLHRQQLNDETSHRPRLFIYYASVGLAFIFIEMAFIQKFSLILGQPLYAVAVTLSVFLVFSAIGSLYVQRQLQRTAKPMNIIASNIIASNTSDMTASLLLKSIMLISLITIIYLLLLPIITDSIMALSASIRILAAILLAAPLAFFMGMPFPIALSITHQTSPQFLPWAWCINGCASVLSSILAIMLAIEIGFSGVMLCAVLLYLIAWFSFKKN